MEAAEAEAPLVLEGFRVRRYRAVRDSGFVPVFPLTALVGREQAGKTSLLTALGGLDPRVARPYDLGSDWPRDLASAGSAAHVVCAANFRLAEHAVGALPAALVDGDLAAPARLCVGRRYDGSFVAERIDASESAPLEACRAGGGERAVGGAELEEFLAENLPRLLAAGPDALLPGRFALAALDGSRSGDARGAVSSEEDGVPALVRLLDRAGGELGAERRPFRGAGPLANLRLDLEGEELVLRTFAGTGEVEVADLSHAERFRLALELRLAAARLDRPAPAVLLLDGPGRAFRHRHHDLLRELFDDAVRAGHRVVYTSRLPFELQLQHPEQVLVLAPPRRAAPESELGEPLVVRSVVTEGERLRLHAALGITGRTSFRVDDLNLVVEGTSDAEILRALDALLVRAGEPGLPSGINVVNAQGSYEVVAVARFLARQGLGVVALLDSDDAGVAASERLTEFLAREPEPLRVEVLLLADAAQLPIEAAVIEDLFPPSYYSAVVEQFDRDRDRGSRTDRAEDTGGAAVDNGRHRPKGRVARALRAKLDELATPEELPPEMLAPVRRLMASLREAAERLCDGEPH